MQEKPTIGGATAGGATAAPPTLWAKRLRWAGWAILCGGALTALLIYIFVPTPLAVPDLASDRAYTFEVERIGGKSAVYIAQFNRWFSGLWHGSALAGTLAVLSLVLALVCFWFADLLAYPLPPEADRPPDNAG